MEATLAGNVGAVLDMLGRDDAEVLLERAVELNQVLGAELGLRTAIGNLAVFHLNRGRLEEAAGGFARAADLAHRHRDIRHAAVWTRWTATVALFLGRTEEARVAAEAGRALAVESGFAAEIAAVTALLGHVALAAGEDASGWWERAHAAGPSEAAKTLRAAIDAADRGEALAGGFALDELPPRLAARLRGGAS